MALFTYIDGIPLKDMTHSALLNAMKEHVFFQFMQSGRSGFENGAADVVTNISEWYCQRGKAARGKKLNNEEFDEIKRFLVITLVDRFMTHGVEGLKNAIFDGFTMIYDTLQHPAD